MIQKLEYETHKDGNGNVYGAIPSDAEIIAKINEVIDYINSLPEETNEAASTMAPSCWGEEQDGVGLVNGLEEEVKRYYSDNFTYISSDQPTLSILTNVARHFAEWQNWQMMKDAVEGEVENSCFGIVYLRKNLMNEGYSTGDKVKIIIVKED